MVLQCAFVSLIRMNPMFLYLEALLSDHYQAVLGDGTLVDPCDVFKDLCAKLVYNRVRVYTHTTYLEKLTRCRV